MKPESPINVNDPDYDDPILTELRQIREEFSDMFNGDLEAMVRYIQEEERKLPPERISSRLPQPIKRPHAGNERRCS